MIYPRVIITFPTQTALLPHHHSLINLSKYLVSHRPPTDVPFPGTPDTSDLDVLYHPTPDAESVLTPQDITDLKDLHADLNAICKHAHERGVRIIIDAEHRSVLSQLICGKRSLIMLWSELVGTK